MEASASPSRRSHFVHIADWEDNAHIVAFGNAPAQWTVYCAQFPRSCTFHLDTAAWNCHTRVNVPWQPTPPHLTICDTLPLPFFCTNLNCLWFAIISLWPKPTIRDQPSIYRQFLVRLLYTLPFLLAGTTSHMQYPCNAVLISWISWLSLCGRRRKCCSCSSSWLASRYHSGLQNHRTCLVKAAINDNLHEYPTHWDHLPKINSIGKVDLDLAHRWRTDDSVAPVAFFLCSL